MSLISLIVVIAIIGVALYVLNAVVPMDAKVKTILNAVVIIALLLWLLEAFGVLNGPAFGPRLR